MVKVFWITLWAFIADRITKTAVIGMNKIEVLPFLNLIYAKNTGAGFSLFQDARIFLILVTLAVLYAMYKYKDYLTENHPLATALILAGALGNLFDRIFLGYVIDFIDLYAGTYHWPTFNIADSALVIGVILIYVKSRKS